MKGTFKQQHGISLLELVFVILVLTISAAFVAAALVPAAKSIEVDEYIRTATREAQECMTHVIMRRRQQGIPGWTTNIAVASPSTLCNSLGIAAGFTRTLNITDTTSAGTPACPSAAAGTCKLAVVTVVHTDSGYSADLRMMFVNY